MTNAPDDATASTSDAPVARGCADGVQSKRDALINGKGELAIGRRPAPSQPADPGRRRRIVIGLVLSVVALVAVLGLVMGLAADISQ